MSAAGVDLGPHRKVPFAGVTLQVLLLLTVKRRGLAFATASQRYYSSEFLCNALQAGKDAPEIPTLKFDSMTMFEGILVSGYPKRLLNPAAVAFLCYLLAQRCDSGPALLCCYCIEQLGSNPAARPAKHWVNITTRSSKRLARPVIQAGPRCSVTSSTRPAAARPMR